MGHNSGRVLPYPVTGDSGPVFPDSAAVPNRWGEWAFLGFALINLSTLASYRVTFTAENGDLIETLDLAPGESRSEWLGPQGMTFRERLNVTFTPDTASTIVVGSVRVG